MVVAPYKKLRFKNIHNASDVQHMAYAFMTPMRYFISDADRPIFNWFPTVDHPFEVTFLNSEMQMVVRPPPKSLSVSDCIPMPPLICKP